MPGNNGWGVVKGRSRPLPCSSASAPPLLGSRPRAPGSEGRRASEGELAPGTLTLGPAFRAPAAVWPPGLPEQPVAPASRPSSRALLRTSPALPSLHRSLWQFQSCSRHLSSCGL